MQLRTLSPPKDAAEPSSPWTSKTPTTANEAQSQTEYLKSRVRRHYSSSPESIIKAIQSLTKAVKRTIYETTLMRNEIRNLREGNKKLSRRRRSKRTRLQKGDPTTVQEASQVIDQIDIDTQVVGESSRSGG
jgi:FtsZ-binding cell division protein ZapB